MCVCACECMYQFHKKGNFFKRTLFIVWLFFFQVLLIIRISRQQSPLFFHFNQKQLKKCWGRGSIISPTCQLNGITHLINSSSYISFYSPIWHLHRGVKILKRINKKNPFEWWLHGTHFSAIVRYIWPTERVDCLSDIPEKLWNILGRPVYLQTLFDHTWVQNTSLITAVVLCNTAGNAILIDKTHR